MKRNILSRPHKFNTYSDMVSICSYFSLSTLWKAFHKKFGEKPHVLTKAETLQLTKVKSDE